MPAGSSPWTPAKYADPDARLDDLRPLKNKARQPVAIPAAEPRAERIAAKKLRRIHMLKERFEQLPDRVVRLPMRLSFFMNCAGLKMRLLDSAIQNGSLPLHWRSGPERDVLRLFAAWHHEHRALCGFQNTRRDVAR